MKFTKLTDDKRDITFEVKGELPMTDKSNIIYMNTPSFTGRNVPITEIANVIGKSPETIRYAIREGIFHFGVAIQSDKSDGYSYYCPDKRVWEETGYFSDNYH